MTASVLDATAPVLAATTTDLALLPGFLDPVNLLNSFGTWMLAGLLLVVFIESGLLFPLLPGDSLLFTAGLIVAAKSTEIEPFAPLWVLLLAGSGGTDGDDAFLVAMGTDGLVKRVTGLG